MARVTTAVAGISVIPFADGPDFLRSPAQHPVHPGRSAPCGLRELLRRRLHRHAAHRRHRRGRHPLRAGVLGLTAVRAGTHSAADRHERRAHRRGRQPARAPARLPRGRHPHVAGAAGRSRLPHGGDRQDALLPVGRRARLPRAGGVRGQALAPDPATTTRATWKPTAWPSCAGRSTATTCARAGRRPRTSRGSTPATASRAGRRAGSSSGMQARKHRGR